MADVLLRFAGSVTGITLVMAFASVAEAVLVSRRKKGRLP